MPGSFFGITPSSGVTGRAVADKLFHVALCLLQVDAASGIVMKSNTRLKGYLRAGLPGLVILAIAATAQAQTGTQSHLHSTLFPDSLDLDERYWKAIQLISDVTRSEDVQSAAGAEIAALCHDHSHAFACATLGDAFIEAGDPDLVEKAYQVYDRACRAGYGYGCTEQGQLQYSKQLGGRNHAEALQLFERGCELSHRTGCRYAGYMYRKGEGQAQDHAKARAAYNRGCTLQDGISCFYAGYYEQTGKGGLADKAAARQAYEKGCSINSPDSCFNLGHMNYHGQGGEMDRPRARNLYRKACDLNHAEACRNLWVMRRNGVGGQADASGAAEARTRACALGDNSVCPS